MRGSKPTETELLPERVWLNRHYPCLYRLVPLSTEDVEYVPRTPSLSDAPDEQDYQTADVLDAAIAQGKRSQGLVAALSTPQPTLQQAIECVEDVLDQWNGDYEEYALSGAPTGSAAKEQINRFANEIITALSSLAGTQE